MNKITAWMDQQTPTTIPRFTPRQSVAIVAAAFLLGFGAATVNAIGIFITGDDTWRMPGNPSYLWSVLRDFAAIALAIWALNRVSPGTWWKPGPLQLATIKRPGVDAFAFFTVVVTFTFTVVNAIFTMPEYPRPEDPTTTEILQGILSSILAGPLEEIVVVALPLILLRLAGARWSIVVCALVAMRVVFHLYYGWTALGLSIWAVAVIFIYLHTRSIVGLILAHSWFDLTADASIVFGSPIVGGLLRAATFAICAYLAIRALTAIDDRRRGKLTRTTTQGPTPTKE